MTTFSIHAFGSLSLCSMAALSGTLGVGELLALLWLPFQAHPACRRKASLTHMHWAQVPFFLSPTSFPKAKSAKFCLLWSWSLTTIIAPSYRHAYTSPSSPALPRAVKVRELSLDTSSRVLFRAWSNLWLRNNHFTVWNLSQWINMILLLLSLDVELYWRKLLFFHTEFCFRVVCVKNNTNKSIFGWSYWTVSKKKSTVWWREICL